MPPKMTHDQCCLKVCFICGNEAGKGDRKITEAEVKLIKAHVLHSFNPGDERYLDLTIDILPIGRLFDSNLDFLSLPAPPVGTG